jgi:hypothetical protein
MASLSSYGGKLSNFGNTGGNANLTDAGAWADNVGYLKNVVVSQGGSLYINKIQPNFDVTPGTDATKWEPIAASSESYPVLIGTFAPPDGVVGEAYSYDLAPLFAGSDLVFSQTAGTLLSTVGLELVGSVIQGTLTAEGDLSGVIIKAENSHGFAVTDEASFAVGALEFNGPIVLPDATVDIFYSFSIAPYFSGTAPLVYAQSAGDLLSEAGLTLDTATGEISGTPTAYDFTGLKFTATNDFDTVESNEITLTVEAPIVPKRLRFPDDNTTAYCSFTPMVLNTGDKVEFIANVGTLIAIGEGTRTFIAKSGFTGNDGRVRTLNLNELLFNSTVSVYLDDGTGGGFAEQTSDTAHALEAFDTGADFTIRIVANVDAVRFDHIGADLDLANKMKKFSFRDLKFFIGASVYTFSMSEVKTDGQTEESVEDATKVMTYHATTSEMWEEYSPDVPVFIGNLNLADAITGQSISYPTASLFAGSEFITSFELDGTLPTGLSLDTDTGIISGTYSAAGTFANYRVIAHHAFGTTPTNFDTSVVTTPVAPAVSPTYGFPPYIYVGQEFIYYVYEDFTTLVSLIELASGTLPDWLDWLNDDPNTQTLTGTPIATGTVSGLSFTGTNSEGSVTTPVYADMSIIELPDAPVFTGTIPTVIADIGIAIDIDLSGYFTNVAGGIGEFSVGAGNLPVGLNIHPTTGHLYGTRISEDAEDHSVTIIGQNATDSAESNLFLITVTP